jgi:hypothetical protein
MISKKKRKKKKEEKYFKNILNILSRYYRYLQKDFNEKNIMILKKVVNGD